MGKKKQNSTLGKAIIRDRFGKKERSVGSDNFLHTADLQDGYDWGRLNLQSVTEQNNLDDFLATAELAGTEFTAEKLNVKFVSQDTGCLPKADELKTIRGLHQQHEKLLRIPRRPPWHTGMAPSELDQNEKTAFLEWRRTLASLQEDERIVMTPYEKNLDFWRQLWRVIERSDIVVQIVDARNPLVFYCADVESYVREVDSKKLCMVLINKADFLTQQQRDVWADYFTKRGIRIAFWSAVNETARQEEENKAELVEDGPEDIEDEENESEDDSDHVDEEMNENTNNVNADVNDVEMNEVAKNKETDVGNKAMDVIDHIEADKDISNVDNHCDCDSSDSQAVSMSDNQTCNTCGKITEDRNFGETPDILNTSRLYTGPELLDLLKSLHKTKKVQDGLTTVGMVGYPNVGKSSTINAILKMKKVPVSATPGRTKHFQTLFVDSTLMLCDCPGLVFPSFVTTKADLVVNGILPIDQMRDSLSPTALLCQRLPRWLLESTYGINIPQPREGEDPNRPPTAHELLHSYGAMRGFMTSRGSPDGPRSSRYLLKDYVNGKLLYCHPPPDQEDPVEFNKFQEREPASASSSVGTLNAGNQTGENVVAPSRIDADFFRKKHSTVHTRTAHGQEAKSSTSSPGSSQASLNDKPWKKHNNRKKREKLRRVYGYLDKCD